MKTSRIDQFKEQTQIANTGRDNDGKEYNDLGRINAGCWVGENAGWLYRRIEKLEAALRSAIAQDPSHRKEIASNALIEN